MKPVFSFATVNDCDDFIPKKAEEKSVGLDVKARCENPIYIHPNSEGLIPLGFKAFVPEGYYYELHPRSSTFVKKGFICLVGIIDESFEGEVQLAYKYFGKETVIINDKDRVGQLILKKVVDADVKALSMDELQDLYKARGGTRGEGGIGSTGK